MRVAILIVGEFRCFEFARPHWAFLDQQDPELDIDVYLQTWNQSRLYNGVRCGHRDWNTMGGPMQSITEHYVRGVLRRPAVINICPEPDQDPDIPMIRGWLLGMDMIRNSGKQYDYVLMVRPDLYWEAPPLFVVDEVKKFADPGKVGFMIKPSSKSSGLEDTCIFGRYETISRVLSYDLVEKIIREGYGGWHQLWQDYVENVCNLEVHQMPLNVRRYTIARWPASHSTTYTDMMKQWQLWWHQQEKIAICVSGDFLGFTRSQENFAFLSQGGISAVNYFCFFDRSVWSLPGSTLVHEQKFSESSVPDLLNGVKHPRYHRVLELPATQDPFERIIIQWLEILQLVEQTKQGIMYVLLVSPEVLFTQPTKIDLQHIWPILPDDNPYNQDISISVDADGLCNADVIFGKLNFIQKIINHDLLADWQQQLANGNAHWKSFWNTRLSNINKIPLPLSNQEYVRLLPYVTPEMGFDDIKKIQAAWDDYHLNIVPKLNRMTATQEVRQLHIPDILKQNLALRDLLVIFDLDGVLLESKEMHYETLNAALAEVDSKYVISLQDHHDRYDGLPTSKKLRMLTEERGLPEQEHQNIWHNKQKNTVAWLRKMEYQDDRLPNLFRVLKSQNCTIAVASNSIRDTVKTALLYMHLIDYVDYFISNEDVRHAKPHPEMFWRCMIDLNFVPDCTIVVEDSTVGLQAAYHSGAQVMQVRNPHEISLVQLEKTAQKLKLRKQS